MGTNGTFRIVDSVEIAMRDGSNLRANVWLPDGTGQWPVLLQRTPYQKDDAFSTLDFLAALRRGYAIVVQDTRGRFASDGTFTPFANEADDGIDTIAWLRQQGFCNGQVMMFWRLLCRGHASPGCGCSSQRADCGLAVPDHRAPWRHLDLSRAERTNWPFSCYGSSKASARRICGAASMTCRRQMQSGPGASLLTSKKIRRWPSPGCQFLMMT
jgi:hypothetical protein